MNEYSWAPQRVINSRIKPSKATLPIDVFVVTDCSQLLDQSQRPKLAVEC